MRGLLRLEDNTREVSWTVSAKITVGYHQCGVCNVENPPPTMDMLLEFALKHGGGYMWPAADPKDGYMPTNWTNDHDKGLICPDCTEAKELAFQKRAQIVKGKWEGLLSK